MMRNKIKDIGPYEINSKQKKIFFQKEINLLTKHHYSNSSQYKNLLNSFKYNLSNMKLENFPFLPTQIFKELDLFSVDKKDILKKIMSSGTSGSSPSKIYLDRENARNQIFVLAKIMSTILGKSRLPMLIVDSNLKNSNRESFNARVAAINGFSTFGKNHTYLLNQDETINFDLLRKFMKEFGDKPFFIFGFTSYIFKSLIEQFPNDNQFNFTNGVLLHGGGWKKMEEKKIDSKLFKNLLKKKLKLKNIYNYYGLIEQTGSIFLECPKCSCFRTTAFSDILIRDKHFNVVPDGTKGLIQLFSILPTSYPGHVVLTEDVGTIIDDKKCSCSKSGKRFKVLGRSKKSEVRGCSDTI